MADFFKKVGKKFESLKKHKMGALVHFEVPETPDEEFQAAASTFYATRDHIVTLVDSADNFMDKMQSFTKSLEGVTENFATTMSTEQENAGAAISDAAAATQVMFDFSNSMQENCINFFNKNVLENLKKKLSDIKAIVKEVKQRKELKGEYDYYYEKVRKLREKSGDSAKNQEKVDRNEPKLEEARLALKKASAPLRVLFQELEAMRPKFVAFEYEHFKQCQKAFFSIGSQKFDTLLDSASEFKFVPMPKLKKDVDDSVLEAQSNTKSEVVGDDGASASVDVNDDGDSATSPNTENNDTVAAEQIPEPTLNTEENSENTEAPMKGAPAEALFDFEPNAEDELKLVAGEHLVVYVQNEGGWWEGEANGQVGLFPASYVKLID